MNEQYDKIMDAIAASDPEFGLIVWTGLTTLLLNQGGVPVSELHRALDATEETVLAEVLGNYTNPNHDDYDPKFDEEIRRLRPDWFEVTA